MTPARSKTKRIPRGEYATIADFLVVTAGIHLSSYVDSPFQDRGGLMLVGPPGTLKTTIVEFLDRSFPDSLVLSDINAQGLAKVKHRVSTGGIRSIVFPELRKIYQRHSSVAENVEGTIQAFAAEGFSAASFEDATISRLKAKATIFAALTPALRDKKTFDWDESGFSRRFLWSLVYLRDPVALERAVVDGKLISIAQCDTPRAPVSGMIPDLTTEKERAEMALWVKHQPTPHNVQLIVLSKTWAVLKWWARQQGKSETRAWEVLRRVGYSFGKAGVVVDIE